MADMTNLCIRQNILEKTCVKLINKYILFFNNIEYINILKNNFDEIKNGNSLYLNDLLNELNINNVIFEKIIQITLINFPIKYENIHQSYGLIIDDNNLEVINKKLMNGTDYIILTSYELNLYDKDNSIQYIEEYEILKYNRPKKCN